MKIIHSFLLFMNFSLFFCNFEISFKYQSPKKNVNDFLFNYFHNDLIVETHLGSNSQFLPLQIKFRSYYTFVISKDNDGFENIYNPNSSDTSKKLSDSFIGEEEFGFSTIYSDIFSIENQKISEFNFIFSNKLSIFKHLKSSGVLGFNLALTYSYNVDSLIKQLKQKKLINDYYFSLIYTNENDGKITIGKKYDEKKYEQIGQSANAFESSNYEIGWNIKMSNIILDYENNKTEIAKNKNTFFYPEFIGIIADLHYFNLIEKEFFSKFKECKKDIFHLEGYDKLEEDIEEYSTYGDMNYFICDEKGFNPKDFPNITFYSSSLNLTFTFDYKDLFVKNENNYYHLVVAPVDDSLHYIIGKPIFKNYILEFNYDRKIMNVYVKKSNSKSSKFFVLYIFLVLIIISIIIYIIYFKFIIHKLKKKRQANELIEDYNSSFLEKNVNKLGI